MIARSAAATEPTDTMAMMWVGENPTAAPETLRFLVGVRSRTPTAKLGLNHTWVEAAAARNAATPDDALALLAARPPTPNPSPNVPEQSWLRSPHKQWVARNPGASLRTLTALAGTVDGAMAAARWATDPAVVDRAVATAVAAGRVPEGPTWAVLAAAAENPAVSDDQLVEFIGHDGPDCPVSRNIARRPALSAAMAERLAAHPDFYTRLYLVQRQGDLPPDLVARVASGPETHPAIRAAAAAHPSCPPAASAAAGLLAG